MGSETKGAVTSFILPQWRTTRPSAHRHEGTVRETLRAMQNDVHVVGLRRLEDRRGISRLVKGRRVYEVSMSDGTLRLLSFAELDKVVDARRHPADFWACVQAVDAERDHLGDHEQPRITSWPSGTPRADRAAYEEIAGLLRVLLIRLDNRLPRKDFTLIAEFIDANELGLALEQMADAMSEDQQPLSTDERNDMLALAARIHLGDRVQRALEFCPAR